eukprot:CAMPEP_0205814598 /NCGR_PEP_ID=MMETSP0205-20121125/19853_1 /ASSEMBLY_ACC=CAM_ASM_000278 /TAXON_ID=36767 /ORGANISM="Euplotes focardii, Strain TN1" /LENGTH=118 /DNA_ID=CAMNT_0053099039 /DNA_START=77 /DNA_END=433 /DNA_ORIENTATION=+
MAIQHDEDLVGLFEKVGISSKSKAKKFVEKNNHWGCCRCVQVYDKKSELKAHLREMPKHRFGQSEVRGEKRQFNKRMGLDEDDDLRPLKEYSEERMTPGLKKTYFKLISLHAQLVNLY